MSIILVINSGSSSIKYQLINTTTEERLATGYIDRIGSEKSQVTHNQNGNKILYHLPIRDHAEGFRQITSAFQSAGTPLDSVELQAVGHRVVQGGTMFIAPTLIDDEVAEKILELSPLAPLHNPGHYQAIIAARNIFRDVAHVAVFDTAFHQSMPQKAYTYAIDTKVARAHNIRKYGYHGTSHQVVSRRAAEFAQLPLDRSLQVVLHLGNGASACAIRNGHSIDTSMGLTPLAGLVMGTRSGDIDPSVFGILAQEENMSVEEIIHFLNHKSGLLGLTGSNDMRDVYERALKGEKQAELAMRIFAYRIRHYLGAYMLELGGLDILTFTGGVGENSARIRELVCQKLHAFGIELDAKANSSGESGPRSIHAKNSKVQILVIPTDEELEIARQVAAFTS